MLAACTPGLLHNAQVLFKRVFPTWQHRALVRLERWTPALKHNGLPTPAPRPGSVLQHHMLNLVLIPAFPNLRVLTLSLAVQMQHDVVTRRNTPGLHI